METGHAATVLTVTPLVRLASRSVLRRMTASILLTRAAASPSSLGSCKADRFSKSASVSFSKPREPRNLCHPSHHAPRLIPSLLSNAGAVVIAPLGDSDQIKRGRRKLSLIGSVTLSLRTVPSRAFNLPRTLKIR